MGKGKSETVYKVSWKDGGESRARFAEGLFDEDNPALAEMLLGAKCVPEGEKPPRLLLVADANVVHRTEGLGTDIGRYLNACGIELAGSPVVLSGGEKTKSDDMVSARRTLDAAVSARIGRDDFMLALGGGATLDVAGWAAAQARRGTRLVFAPTTPASMLEAPFMTRACLNFGGIKDSIGAPCRPFATVIDTTFARTVLDGVWRGGAGEMVRHAAARDASMLKNIAQAAPDVRRRDRDAMDELLRGCIESRFKKGSTTFAAWSAARMETMSGNRLPHGYAVPLAICIDCAYSCAKGTLEREEMAAVCSALADSGALDGLAHSLHILDRAQEILYGLDAWRLATGDGAVEILKGIGKTILEKEPDRGLYEKAINDFHDASSGEQDRDGDEDSDADADDAANDADGDAGDAAETGGGGAD